MVHIVDYLIHPSPNDLTNRRPGTGAAVIAVYYILLFPLLVCYGRLLHTIFTDPGFVPRGEGYYKQKNDQEKNSIRYRRRSRSGSSTSQRTEGTNSIAGIPDSGSIHGPESTDSHGGKYGVSLPARSDEQMVEAGLEDRLQVRPVQGEDVLHPRRHQGPNHQLPARDHGHRLRSLYCL